MIHPEELTHLACGFINCGFGFGNGDIKDCSKLLSALMGQWMCFGPSLIPAGHLFMCHR